MPEHAGTVASGRVEKRTPAFAAHAESKMMGSGYAGSVPTAMSCTVSDGAMVTLTRSAALMENAAASGTAMVISLSDTRVTMAGVRMG